MPIYEYKCASCGHQQEFLQKLGAAPHTKCPECGKETFAKMLTAAGFQLKGSGWYATDFKSKGGGASKPADAASEGKSDAKPDAKSDAKPDTKTDSKSGGESKGEGGKQASSGPSCGAGSGSAC
jgi:putative FmdB family regulatory protein